MQAFTPVSRITGSWIPSNLLDMYGNCSHSRLKENCSFGEFGGGGIGCSAEVTSAEKATEPECLSGNIIPMKMCQCQFDRIVKNVRHVYRDFNVN